MLNVIDLMKPLNTSPFMPECKRKCSKGTLPVPLASIASKVKRKFSTSGCVHFLRFDV